MFRPYKIEVSLRGPEIAQWIDTYIATPGGEAKPDPGPVIANSSYEAYVTWSFPVEEQRPRPTFRLLASVIKQFKLIVPDGEELMLNHQNDLRIEITGGPR